MPKPEMEGQLLNNLALACWRARNDLDRRPEAYPKDEDKQAILTDEGFILEYFK